MFFDISKIAKQNLNFMEIKHVQDYFKRRIVAEKYKLVSVIRAYVNVYAYLLVDDRPFLIKINESEVVQDGDIQENYIQLGEFTKQQQRLIYEQFQNI